MKFERVYEVTSHDTDIYNNMRPSIIIRYLQETATHQMLERKPSYAELFDSGISLILTRMDVEITEQLHQFDPILVRTWRCESRRATLRRCFEIERDGVRCVRAYSEWTNVRLSDHTILPADAVDFSEYEMDEIENLRFAPKFRFSKEIPFREIGVHRVNYAEIDRNRHMNNTNYPDMLWSRISDVEDGELTSIRLHFRKEGALGADMHMFYAPLPASFSQDPAADEQHGFRTEIDGKTNVEAVFGMKRRNR